MRSLSLPLLALALMTCSPAGAQPPAKDCIDVTRPVHDFQIESPTSVVVVQAPHRTYRVTLARECPNLLDASGVSLANGIPRQIGYRDGRPIWANTLNGYSPICGRVGDRLMLRGAFEDFSMPMEDCQISSVKRLIPR